MFCFSSFFICFLSRSLSLSQLVFCFFYLVVVWSFSCFLFVLKGSSFTFAFLCALFFLIVFSFLFFFPSRRWKTNLPFAEIVSVLFHSVFAVHPWRVCVFVCMYVCVCVCVGKGFSWPRKCYACKLSIFFWYDCTEQSEIVSPFSYVLSFFVCFLPCLFERIVHFFSPSLSAGGKDR